MNAETNSRWEARLLGSDTWRAATSEEIAKATRVSLCGRFHKPDGWECFIGFGRSLTVVSCTTS
jgi:hypothetical protein